MFELMKVTDVFVRNTSTDGDSLSVKEALYLHKKVICSDAVDRPLGVRLFHYSDSESLESCLANDNYDQMASIESGEYELLKLYQNLQNKNNK